MQINAYFHVLAHGHAHSNAQIQLQVHSIELANAKPHAHTLAHSSYQLSMKIHMDMIFLFCCIST